MCFSVIIVVIFAWAPHFPIKEPVYKEIHWLVGRLEENKEIIYA
jgi:hypothetical protein